jgi:hypothetical protein
MLQCCEKMRRQLPAIEHPLINQVGEQADATELGSKLAPARACCSTPANASHAIDRSRRGPEGVRRFIGAFGHSACIPSALTITAALSDPAGGT